MTVFRRPGMTTVAVLVGIVAALVVVSLAAPGWARGAGLDVWNLPAVRADEAAAHSRRHDLEDQHDRLWQQVAAGERVIDRLIAGESTLADAVTELARINHDRSGFILGLRCHNVALRGAPERVLVATYAVEKVERRFRDDPSAGRRDEVLPRLRAELAAIE